jgi:hypothetical protein
VRAIAEGRSIRGLPRWLAFRVVLSLPVVAAVLLVYRPALGPLRLVPRIRPFGVAQTQLLVDTRHSPLTDATLVTQETDQLAQDLAEVTDSQAILAPIASELHISLRDIGTSEQLVGNVSLNDTYAQEAEVGNSLISDARHYLLTLRVDQNSFVIQVFTQAPTGAEAIVMADATAHGLQRYIGHLASTERIPMNHRVVLRQLGPATGGLVDRGITLESLILLALAFLALEAAALRVLRRRRRSER